jgi:hypothetical protein
VGATFACCCGGGGVVVGGFDGWTMVFEQPASAMQPANATAIAMARRALGFILASLGQARMRTPVGAVQRAPRIAHAHASTRAKNA